jgi:spore germination protein GerM
MTRSKLVILAVLAVLLAVLVYFFFRGGRSGFRLETAPSAGKAAPSSVAEGEMKTITLFFLSEDDDRLHPEERRVVSGASLAEDVETSVRELLKGSSNGLLSPFPPEAGLRQVFVTGDGTATVDLSKAVQDDFAYGSSSEIGAIYSLVNTLAFNFKAVKKVSILIDGGERETLGGHIDLSRPLVPQFSLIAR